MEGKKYSGLSFGFDGVHNSTVEAPENNQGTNKINFIPASVEEVMFLKQREETENMKSIKLIHKTDFLKDRRGIGLFWPEEAEYGKKYYRRQCDELLNDLKDAVGKNCKAIDAAEAIAEVLSSINFGRPSAFTIPESFYEEHQYLLKSYYRGDLIYNSMAAALYFLHNETISNDKKIDCPGKYRFIDATGSTIEQTNFEIVEKKSELVPLHFIYDKSTEKQTNIKDTAIKNSFSEIKPEYFKYSGLMADVIKIGKQTQMVPKGEGKWANETFISEPLVKKITAEIYALIPESNGQAIKTIILVPFDIGQSTRDDIVFVSIEQLAQGAALFEYRKATPDLSTYISYLPELKLKVRKGSYRGGDYIPLVKANTNITASGVYTDSLSDAARLPCGQNSLKFPLVRRYGQSKERRKIIRYFSSPPPCDISFNINVEMHVASGYPKVTLFCNENNEDSAKEWFNEHYGGGGIPFDWQNMRESAESQCYPPLKQNDADFQKKTTAEFKKLFENWIPQGKPRKAFIDNAHKNENEFNAFLSCVLRAGRNDPKFGEINSWAYHLKNPDWEKLQKLNDISSKIQKLRGYINYSNKNLYFEKIDDKHLFAAAKIADKPSDWIKLLDFYNKTANWANCIYLILTRNEGAYKETSSKKVEIKRAVEKYFKRQNAIKDKEDFQKYILLGWAMLRYRKNDADFLPIDKIEDEPIYQFVKNFIDQGNVDDKIEKKLISFKKYLDGNASDEDANLLYGN